MQLELKEDSKNTKAVGAKIFAKTGNLSQFYELQPVRGFQSSVSHRIHIGLGSHVQVDSVKIVWPDQTVQFLTNLKANQLISVLKNSTPTTLTPSISTPLLTLSKNSPQSPFKSIGFNDFKRQPLMLTMPSYISPSLASGDLNNDGNLEVFVGGTKGQKSAIYSLIEDQWIPYLGFSPNDGTTASTAIMEDFNQDGTLDLFIGNGGYHDYVGSDEDLEDHLYLNDGNGKLIKSPFPTYKFSTGTAQAMDINQDGALDLFIGAKLIPGKYPQLVSSKILLNDGKGSFTEQSANFLPSEGKLGILTSSAQIDLNKDGFLDLIIAGEFMNIQFLINEKGKQFSDQTSSYLKSSLKGIWNTLATGDFDGDGDLDLVVGNLGLNTQFVTDSTKILRLYSKDFDQNGSIDPILECFIEDGMYPFPSRDELLDQMVSMRKKFTTYESYSQAKMNDLFTAEELVSAQILEVNILESIYLENTPQGFVSHALPRIAQATPIYAILPIDLNQDGFLDLILGGNQSYSKIRLGKLDAGLGLTLINDGKGSFRPLEPNQSGLKIKGDVKSILKLEIKKQTQILVGINQQPLQLYFLK
jgi:hypothetical protein